MLYKSLFFPRSQIFLIPEHLFLMEKVIDKDSPCQQFLIDRDPLEFGLLLKDLARFDTRGAESYLS